MEQLNKIIKDYLLADNTDYAIMINGVWGCGKSYYLNHEFKDVVLSTDAPAGIIQKSRVFGKKTEKRKYKKAYISLYGLSSAEDFYHRVFCGINSWAQNGFVGFVGTGISKAAQFLGISAEKSDTKAITRIDTNHVLVFDDLERITDDKISIKEVLGLINKYAEHDKRKVVMVCNEEHFLGEDADESTRTDYKKYKEKSIRFTYNYEADVCKVYDAMISNLDNVEYQKCLSDRKTDFLHVYRIGDGRNLRSLKFFVDTFEQLYDLVKTEKYKDRLITKLATTHLLYSMEYKSGKTKDDLSGLDSSKYKIDTSFLSLGKAEEPNEHKDYPTEFRERYTAVMDDFVPCDAIIDYVVNGYLNVEEVGTVIKNLNENFVRMEGTPEGRIYQKLYALDKINDEEVKPAVDEMMGFVEGDKYNIYDLLYIYALLLKYNFIGNVKLTNKMTESIQKSMLRQKDTHVHNPMFSMKTPIWDDSERGSDSYDKYKQMKDAAEKINHQAKVKNEKTRVERFMTFAENGDVDSLRKMRMENESMHLTGIDWRRITNVIEKSSNPVACEVCDSLLVYIRRGMMTPDDEYSIKKELKPWVDGYMSKGNKLIRTTRVRELQQHLSDL